LEGGNVPLEQRSFRSVQPEPALAPTPMLAPSLMAASVELSGPLELDLSIYRGDTGRFRITVTNEDLSPADISGATWDADIRTTANSPTVITNFDVVPVIGDDSSVDVILDETNADLLTAGTLTYDVEMRLGGEVITLVAGTITVTQDVSRPT
jgi:hypothetical protein